MVHIPSLERDVAEAVRLAPRQGPNLELDTYDLCGATRHKPWDETMSGQTVRFVSDHHETNPNAPKGARCLAKILTQAADDLCKSAEFADRRCVIKLRTIDAIAFDCTRLFLSTVLYELVLNAVQAKSTYIEVVATEYQEHLFVQVADNGIGTPHLSPCRSDDDGGPLHAAPACLRAELKAACLLVDLAGGTMSIISASPHFGVRIGFCLPLIATSEQLDE